MKKIELVMVAMASFLVLAPQARGRKRDTNHEVYKTACPSMADVTAPDALKFLNGNPPTQANAICTTWAVYVVGDDHYEAAIPALIKLLDFRRPMIQRWWDHLPGSPYPAVEALEDVGGQSVLPALLGAIEAANTAEVARANATEVWLLIYRIGDKQSHGFAALRRAAMKSTDDDVKKRIDEAIADGMKWCSGGQAAECRQSAADGVDR